MTPDEMKLAVCEKLPELFEIAPNIIGLSTNLRSTGRPIHWPTEGLQVCHEAEKLITSNLKADEYVKYLRQITGTYNRSLVATYEQRLEALCRVWWPERFL